ncbi:MAG: two-component regulator propeller domain-containing protein [Kofleriaceae bacterium]
MLTAGIAAGQPGPASVPAPAVEGNAKTVKRLAPPLGCDRLTIAEGLPNSNVRAVAQDHSGFMWFGTASGLARFDGTAMRVYRPGPEATKISSGYINALVVDASGKLWVGTPENGVNLYDPNTDRFTQYARGAGKLSSDGVTAITRDRKDRMWFAMSGGGLNHFDPATGNFTEFAAKPLDVEITAMHSDKAGNLWLGTASDGVIRWNPDDGTSTSYRVPVGEGSVLGSASITAILVGATGTVWIGSDGEGLISLDPVKRVFTRRAQAGSDPTSISDNHISVLFEDQQNTLWIGTSSGLNRIGAAGRVTRYEYDPDDPATLPFPGVESIFQDKGGVMWVGGFTIGLCKFDQLRLNFGHYRTRAHVSSFFEDTDGTLWVGSYNDGLYKYERANQRVTVYRDISGDTGPVKLENAWLTAVHRDRRGTLWVAMKGQGLLAFNTKTETHRQYLPDPDKPDRLPNDTIFDIWEDDRGRLFLATWGGGLVRFDPQADVFATLTPAGLTSHHLYDLYPDPKDKNVLWIGTAKGGLVSFNLVDGSATSFRHDDEDPASLSSDDVLATYREPSGILWVGTLGGGVNRLDPATGRTERFTTSNSGLTNDAVYGILPDPDGNLWLSTDGGGLLQLDPKSRKFAVYGASDGVQSSEFSQGSSMRSKSGELFFGGARGFNAFQPKQIKRDTYSPPVVLTGFTIKNQEVKIGRPIWTLPTIDVSHEDSFEVQFAALSFAAPKQARYAYKLEGFDEEFVESDRPFATYTRLGGGTYTLRVRAANRHGVWNETGISLKLRVAAPWWRTWPAFLAYLLVFAGIAYLVYRIQRERVRRAEREGRLAVVERDLELTGAVQNGFLPDNNEISTTRFRLCSAYRPAESCGGDWWWHERLSGGRHLIMVGDVTGHGPGPAMVTAAVATAFQVMIENGVDDVKLGSICSIVWCCASRRATTT